MMNTLPPPHAYQPADMTEEEAMRAAMAASMGEAPPPRPPKPVPTAGPAPMSAFQLHQEEATQRRRRIALALFLVALAVCAVAIGVGVKLALGGESGPSSTTSLSGTLPIGANLSRGCSGSEGTRIDPGQNVWACPATWAGEFDMRSLPTGAPCNETTPCTVPSNACAVGFLPCGADGAVSMLQTISAPQCASAGTGSQYFVGGSSHADVTSGANCYTIDSYPLTGGIYPHYGCTDSGWATQPVCCGPGCVSPTCNSGVWPSATIVSPTPSSQGCGHQPAPPEGGGVLCCLMYTTPPPVPQLTFHAGGTVNDGVMPQPRVVGYFWGSSWSNAAYVGDKISGLQQFVSGLQNSTITSLLTQYMQGNPISISWSYYYVDTTAVPTFTNAPSTNPTTQSNDALQAMSEVAAAQVCNYVIGLGATRPPSPQLETTFFAVYLDQARPAWSDWCAFHDYNPCVGSGVDAEIPYGVFWDTSDDIECQLSAAPEGRSQGLTNLASATLHELTESMTDIYSDACALAAPRFLAGD